MFYYKNRFVILYHGDCREYITTIDDGSIQLVITSPPPMGADFDIDVLARIKNPLIDRGVVFWHCLENAEDLAVAAEADDWLVKDIIPWDAPYREREHIVVLTKQENHLWKDTGYKRPWTFQDEQRVLYVCADCGHRTIPRQPCDMCRSNHLIGHSGVFPQTMVQRCMELASGEWVFGSILDPFAGSGTVGVEAYKLRRRTFLIDSQEKSCEMATLRLRHLADKGTE